MRPFVNFPKFVPTWHGGPGPAEEDRTVRFVEVDVASRVRWRLQVRAGETLGGLRCRVAEALLAVGCGTVSRSAPPTPLWLEAVHATSWAPSSDTAHAGAVTSGASDGNSASTAAMAITRSPAVSALDMPADEAPREPLPPPASPPVVYLFNARGAPLDDTQDERPLAEVGVTPMAPEALPEAPYTGRRGLQVVVLDADSPRSTCGDVWSPKAAKAPPRARGRVARDSRTAAGACASGRAADEPCAAVVFAALELEAYARLCLLHGEVEEGHMVAELPPRPLVRFEEGDVTVASFRDALAAGDIVRGYRMVATGLLNPAELRAALFDPDTLSDPVCLHAVLRMHVLDGCLDGELDPQQARFLHYAVHEDASRGDDLDATDSVVQLLLDAGADANVADQYGATPLHVAAEHSVGAVVRRLLAGGADPDALDDEACTALHHAACGGDAATVAALLNHGASADVVNAMGQTPLRAAELATPRNPAVIDALAVCTKGRGRLVHTMQLSDLRS